MWMLRFVSALAEFVGDVPGKNIHDAGIFAAARDDDIRKFHIIGNILAEHGANRRAVLVGDAVDAAPAFQNVALDAAEAQTAVEILAAQGERASVIGRVTATEGVVIR